MHSMARVGSSIPIAAVFAAGLLIVVAAKQQEGYDRTLQQSFPQASHPDYAYSPPARLLAVAVAGPGVLVPSGFAESGLQSARLITSLVAVLLFWYLLLFLLSKSRGEPQVSKARTYLALHTSLAGVATVGAYYSAHSFVEDVAFLGWPLCWQVTKSYGFATVMWVKCVTALWMVTLAALMGRAAIRDACRIRAGTPE